MSDRIAVMMGGEILQCDTPDRIYEDPSDLRVAEFIGSPKINVLPAERDAAGRISVLGVPLAMPLPGPRGPLQLGLRPEAISIDNDAPILMSRSVHLENLGPELLLHVALDGMDQRLTLRVDPSLRGELAPRRAIGLRFDPERALVFDAEGRRLRADAPVREAAFA